jgi:hypothetical protein
LRLLVVTLEERAMAVPTAWIDMVASKESAAVLSHGCSTSVVA